MLEVGTYKQYLDNFIEEQKEIIENIELIELHIEGERRKNIIDYYQRERKELLEDLLNSCKDLQILYHNLE